MKKEPSWKRVLTTRLFSTRSFPNLWCWWCWWYWWYHRFVVHRQTEEKVSASAGSRTRIDCLEGNHANRYTTDAFLDEQLSALSSTSFYQRQRIIGYVLAVIALTVISIIPSGLVVRIPRSHRGGRGSIPRLGKIHFKFVSQLERSLKLRHIL